MSDVMIGPRSLAHGLNLVWALAWRNFTPRTRQESSKLAWVFLEPIGTTIVIAVIYTLIGRGTPYGPSLALFIMTGIVMLSFFSQGGNLISASVTGLSAPSRLATIGVFHEAVARIIFKFVVSSAYFVVLFAIIGQYEAVSLSIDAPLVVLHAFLTVSLLTFGVGLIVGYFMVFFQPVVRVYAIASRAQIFIAGVFYVPSFMPPAFRDMLAWNPLLQVVELLRLGVYGDYPSIVYDPVYLHAFALGATALGLALVWYRRAKLMG
jgi:capsular polysaccharide transport system permease protein